jgi:lysyl-tRNA synthetase class 2
MQPESLSIATIAYDAGRAKLTIQFEDGCAYIYVGVPGEVHRSFLDAGSRNDFFADEICDQYPYNRFEAPLGRGEGQSAS